MDEQLRALAHPTRREILRAAWGADLTASALAARFAVTRPAVSQHLQVLVRADLVTVRRDGVRRFYRTNRATIGRVQRGLAMFWDEALADLKRAVEAERDGGGDA